MHRRLWSLLLVLLPWVVPAPLGCMSAHVRTDLAGAGSGALVGPSPAAATDYEELTYAYIGCIPAYPSLYGDLDPEHTPCHDFAGAYSIGWDCRRSSMVVDLGRPKLVNRLLWLSDLKENPGPIRNLTRANTALYWSNDNRTYTRYRGDFSFLARKGLPGEDAFDVIELSGFELFARYLKVAHGYDGSDYQIANRNQQKACRVFVRRERRAAVRLVPGQESLATGRRSLRVEVTGSAQVLRGASLRVGLGPSRQQVAEIARERVPVTGGAMAITVDVRKVSLGPEILRLSLHDRAGRPLAQQDRDITVYRRILDERDLAQGVTPQPGDLAVLGDVSAGLAAPAAISGADRDGFWRVRDYRVTETGEAGRMLWSRPGQGPDVAYPLRLAGWHAIYLSGLAGSVLEARLSGETEFQPISMPGAESDGAMLRDTFWRCVDVTGKRMVIRAPAGQRPASLARVKLVPLTAEQIEHLQQRQAGRRPAERKRVVVNDDGFSDFFLGRFSDRPTLEAFVDQFQDQVDFCLGASDVFNYASKVGDMFDERFFTGELRQGDRRACELIRALNAAGDVPLQVVVNRAHRNGAKVFASLRLNNSGHVQGRFFAGHPEWRVVTKDSQGRLFQSFAFPEVRQFRIAALLEASGFGVDGVNLDFMRDPLYFGYEKPLVDGFASAYGVKPEAIDPLDGRWQQWQAEHMNRFLRDLRRELAQNGRRLEISVRVPDTLRAALGKGLDVRAWVREGLVDVIMPDLSAHAEEDDIGEFVALVQGTPVRLCPTLDPGLSGRDESADDEKPGAPPKPRNTQMSAAQIKARVAALYRRGVDGISFFNFFPDPMLQRELADGGELVDWAQWCTPPARQGLAITLPE
jgi:hypothetical protein